MGTPMTGTPMRRLPQRSTRGTRMNALAGDDAKFDEEFWNADMFKEEGQDELYFTESESEDEVDADFDAPEPTEAEVDAAAAEEERQVLTVEKKKPQTKSRYVDPERQKAKGKDKAKQTQTTAFLGDVASNKAEEEEEHDQHHAHEAAHAQTSDSITATDIDAPKTSTGKKNEGPPKSRKSTRSLTVKKMAEGQQRRMEEEEEARKKRKRLAKIETPTAVREFTQEELLEEAQETEKLNLRLLEEAMKLEAKQKPVIRKERVVGGPAISFISNRNGDTLTFTKTAQLPETLRQQAPPPPQPHLCCITGLPAKYKDPKTGLRYATAQAFKDLRERFGGTGAMEKTEEASAKSPKQVVPRPEPSSPSSDSKDAARAKRRKSAPAS